MMLAINKGRIGRFLSQLMLILVPSAWRLLGLLDYHHTPLRHTLPQHRALEIAMWQKAVAIDTDV